MSKTIEVIRVIVATDQGYDSWEDFLEWEDADYVAYHLAIEYSNQQTQELQEQNAELVSFLQFLNRKGGLGLDVHAKIDNLLTKHNHLNKKP